MSFYHISIPNRELIGRHAPLLVLALTVAIDRLMTIPYFAHESNPLVSGIGLFPWLAFSLVLIGILTVFWQHISGWEYPEVRFTMYIVALLHTIVIVTQSTVLLLVRP